MLSGTGQVHLYLAKNFTAAAVETTYVYGFIMRSPPCSLTLYTRHLDFEMDTKSENLKPACVLTCRLGKGVGIGRGEGGSGLP